MSGFAIRRLVMADLLPIAVCIRPGSADVIKYVFLSSVVIQLL